MRSRLVSQPEISGSASAEADEMRLAMAPDSHVAEATATSLPLPPPPEKDSSRSRSSAGKAARRDRDTFKLGRSRSERRGSDNSTWKRMLGRVGSFARAGLSRRASQESMGQLHPPAHKPPGVSLSCPLSLSLSPALPLSHVSPRVLSFSSLYFILF
eukprot:1223945-Rhodomonas_salina.1